MSAVCVCVLSLLHLVCVSTVWSEKLAAPENVRVVSLDMGLVLEWDPAQSTSSDLFNYSAEMSGWEKVYEPVCVSSSALSCDFTEKLFIFGTYRLRVRAELRGDTSDWVQTETLSVDKITQISAPHVQVTSRKGQTEVDITDPVTKKRSLREVFGDISYLIHFWKDGETKKEPLLTQQNRVMLPGLEALVKYCVEVEIVYFNNTSHTSNSTCVTNSHSDEAEPRVIVAALLVSFLVVFVALVLGFLAVWYGYRGCRIVFPDVDLPEDLKKFLLQRPQSSVLQVVQESPVREHFCELRILPNSCEDSQEKEEPVRTDKSERCVGADVKQSREEKSEPEQKPLLTEMTL